MWKVNGKKYDLTYFRHPGGTIPIELIKGRDAVDLIRSYHPLAEDKVYQVLDKFVVPGETTLVDSPFNSGDNDFSRDIRQILRDYLAKNGKVRAATWKRLGEYIVMLLLLLCFAGPFFRGAWWALIPTPVLLWVLGVNTFHDAAHFAVAPQRTVGWINSVIPYLFTWFSSPLTWYYQHVVGHHPYVNIKGRDPDFYHFSPLHRYMSWHPLTKVHSFQKWGIWIVWWFGMLGQSFMVDWRFIQHGNYQRVVPVKLSMHRQVLHIIGRVLTFLIFYMWPFWFPSWHAASWGIKLLWTVVPWGIISTLYMSIAHAGHIIQETADEPPSTNFYEHQVRHTHNFGATQGSAFSRAWNFYISGGLNLQIEHHLFPGLNHCHLRELAPLVKEVCLTHQVPYNESPDLFTAIGRHLQRIEDMSHDSVKIQKKTE